MRLPRAVRSLDVIETFVRINKQTYALVDLGQGVEIAAKIDGAWRRGRAVDIKARREMTRFIKTLPKAGRC